MCCVMVRITGLDPALPGFYPSLLGPPLTRDAAMFVDAVHTDSGQYGAAESVGHADYWPNGGRAKQPGCMPFTIYFTAEDFCSHWRSWTFWAESVVGGRFPARRCDSYDTFLRGGCRHNETADMGLLANTR
ncbi:Pancreatic lipase-related protein 2 [Eumeta japonica]|uniref:Pancreatic lipase-related protein 2 n=1 Tax=Eumeta variegata TaxID=151549 RepID=A0A4C1YAW4_EUMVA|nr:Pancreatic lipase-related protein 2 [Eumeta japonica]